LTLLREFIIIKICHNNKEFVGENQFLSGRKKRVSNRAIAIQGGEAPLPMKNNS